VSWPIECIWISFIPKPSVIGIQGPVVRIDIFIVFFLLCLLVIGSESD